MREDGVMNDEAPDPLDRFRRRHGIPPSSVLDEIEDEVIGVVYGIDGYTTAEQALDLTTKLDLAPGKMLLDVGGGRGWPSLFMATESGCDVIVTDPVFEGLETTSSTTGFIRMGTPGMVTADGSALPFRSRTFDAVVHADVLC